MLDNYIVNNETNLTYAKINNTLLYLDSLGKDNIENTVTIDSDKAYRFQGNLFGLFSDMNISTKYHIYTMYINGYTNPSHYKGDKQVFKIPNTAIINYLNNILD